jgi:cytochrome d ubiquinol oxidase subunit I
VERVAMILHFLALAFGLHIVMVNLGIAFSTVIPLLKREGERKKDELYLRTSRQLMNFYAATYALAGVFGTAFTVFLLSFYPAFIGLAGHLTLVPFGVAVLAIAIHFLAITAYWYGWDRWNRDTHFLIGLVLLISVYIIPLGFRTVSAFLNVPQGLELTPKPHLDFMAALLNPTFLPLYLKSLTAALAAGFFTISSAYTLRYLRGERDALRIVEKFMPLAAITFAITIVLGIIYAETLAIFVNYKFVNAFGILIGTRAEHDFSWIFVIKLIMFAVQVMAVLAFLRMRSIGFELKNWFGRAIISAGPASLIAVFAGEMLNSFSQYPYFVAKLGDHDFVASLPEGLRTFLAERLSLELSNPLATSPDLFLITILFLVPLLASATFLLYILLFGREETEIPVG